MGKDTNPHLALPFQGSGESPTKGFHRRRSQYAWFRGLDTKVSKVQGHLLGATSFDLMHLSKGGGLWLKHRAWRV